MEKHSKVPHMRKNPDMKHTMMNTGRLLTCSVMRLQAMSTGHTVMKMLRVVKRNLRRNRMGKISVMPMNEA